MITTDKKIHYVNESLINALKIFYKSDNMQGYDIIVPRCLGFNSYVDRYSQNIYDVFPSLQTNIELYIADPRNYGNTQFIVFDNLKNKNLNKIVFANMFCIKKTKSKRKVDYILLAKSLFNIGKYINHYLANSESSRINIWTNKIGCGYFGGNWKFIEEMINDAWGQYDTIVYNNAK